MDGVSSSSLVRGEQDGKGLLVDCQMEGNDLYAYHRYIYVSFRKEYRMGGADCWNIPLSR